jgi:hypothetical protein
LDHQHPSLSFVVRVTLLGDVISDLLPPNQLFRLLARSSQHNPDFFLLAVSDGGDQVGRDVDVDGK